MGSEGTSRSELTQAMPDHGFANVDFLKIPTSMYQESVADELRGDLARSGPGFDGFLSTGLFLVIDLLEKFGVDVRSFFSRSGHGLFLVAVFDNVFI
jgi:hypothetical protein